MDPLGTARPHSQRSGIFYGSKSGNEWNQPGNNSPFAIRNALAPNIPHQHLHLGSQAQVRVAASSVHYTPSNRNSTRVKH